MTLQTLTIWTTYDFTTLRWDNTFPPPSDLSGLGSRPTSLRGVRVCEFGSRLLWNTDATQYELCEPMEVLTLGATSETTEQGRRHTEKLNGSRAGAKRRLTYKDYKLFVEAK